jgi:hypothetical protein
VEDIRNGQRSKNRDGGEGRGAKQLNLVLYSDCGELFPYNDCGGQRRETVRAGQRWY